MEQANPQVDTSVIVVGPTCDRTASEPTMVDVEALRARRDLIPDRPDLAGMDLAERSTALTEHRVPVEELHQDVARLDDALIAYGVPANDPRRAAIGQLHRETERLVGQSQRRESAAENAWLRSIGQGAEVDRRLQAQAAVFANYSQPARAKRAPCARRLKPRRRGAGRPRAQAARSSARSGDSGEDGPSHPRGRANARSAT